MTIATDPPVSEKQRRAMYAALRGKSTLGIPKSVAEKFVGEGHDAADMSRTDWKGLLRGLFKFLREEAAEPEHQTALDALTRDAAGVAFVDPDGKALFVKRRSKDDDHDGEWAFPGGWTEDGEEPIDAAKREAVEEVGKEAPITEELAPVSRVTSPEGVRYATFYQPVAGPFGVELSEESYAHTWAPLEEPPEPLHPGVRGLLDAVAGDASLEPQVPKTGLHDKIKVALKQPLLSYTKEQLDDAHVNPSPKVKTVYTGGAGVSGDSIDALLSEARAMELRGRADLARRADARLRALFAADAKIEDVEKEVSDKASNPEAIAAWVQRQSDSGKPIPRVIVKAGKDQQPALATTPSSALPYLVVGAIRGKPYRVKFAKSTLVGDAKIAMDWSGCAALAIARRADPDAFELAFDRDSVRDKDADGRLHVATSHISKANICPYWGKEIPDYEKHGLDAERKYLLLRDPDELAKAVPTFNNLPVLSSHVPVTADEHPAEMVIGSTGTDAKFDGTYLDNSLVFWPKAAIDDIESNKKKELSSAYRYRYDPTPGTFGGQRYDGVMRDIVGNHVALVPEGRAGRDVVVGDSQIKENDMAVQLSPRAVVARGALMVYMRPRLAADQKLDFGFLDGVTAKNFSEKRPAIVAGLKKVKLAADADIEDVEKVLDAIEDFKDEIVDRVENQTENIVSDPDDDNAHDSPEMLANVLEFLKGKLSPEDMNELTEMIGREEQITETPEEKAAREEKDATDARARLGRDETEEEKMKRQNDLNADRQARDALVRRARDGLVTQKAMDEAIRTAVDKTRTEMAEQAKQVQEATRAIRPYVGELAMDASLDTADKIYAKALTVLGVKNVDKIHPSAYPALLSSQPTIGTRDRDRPRQAHDALPSGVKSFAERFPGAERIGTV